MTGVPDPASAPLRRRAAVLGHPIAHSLSPVLHRAAYEALGLDWTYDALDCSAAALPELFRRAGAEWVGWSLTMPLKEAVLALLDDVDPVAAQVRAVNTVLFGARRRGANTDVPGLVEVLRSTGAANGPRAAVLGAGATARSALAALTACDVRTVTVHARRPDVQPALRALGDELGLDVGVEPWSRADQGLAAPLVVSTVPAAAADVLASAVRPAANRWLVDVGYAPWPTPLARAWLAAGGHAVSGLELLVHQAVEQVRLMTGREVPADVLRAAGQRALAAA